MKIYHLKRTQRLSISLEEAWAFFSSPKNLSLITPPDLDFKMVYISNGEHMYPGQVIRYKIKIIPGIKTDWMTEVTHVNEPYFFVDEQRFGPYALWHHQHHFKAVDGGIEMTDEVNYAIPFGIIGRLVNTFFVSPKLNRIFDFRYQVLQKMFRKENVLEKLNSL